MSALIRGDAGRRVLICICLGVGLAARAAGAGASESPATLFKTRCSACHTFGQGIRVGPDLKHVTDRRTRPWLVAWIRSSSKLIASGDPTAVSLVHEFKEMRMPDQIDLSEAQIHALLDFFAADGPEAEERARLREAASASPAEIDWGRRLFYGESRLKSGDLACVACHSVSQDAVFGGFGGRLADDLTTAFVRYRDRALDRILKHPCLSRAPALAVSRAEDRESLALRAFLRAVGGGDTHGSAMAGSMPR
jgi:cytochrome c551/c552